MKKHYFSIKVNCHIPNDTLTTDRVQAFEELYDDDACLLLPDTYTENGVPTRMVINCHGAGGTVTTDDSQTEGQALTQYLLANGYAVMDVNGLPHEYAEKRGIDIRHNIGSPIAVRCYVKAYHYVIENFNIKPQVFVHGASMGGISSTNLVLSGCIPVIAHSAFCPVLDAYEEMFLHPWLGGLPKEALGKLYDFEKDEKGEYLYEEKKLLGHNPACNEKAKHYPVPVKFWQCEDDPIVSYAVTQRFVDAIRQNGGMAYLRAFPYGGHEPQLVGKAIDAPCGRTVLDGRTFEIKPAVEEAFLWIRSLD